MKKLHFKRFSIIFSFVLLFGLLLSCLILSASSGQVAYANGLQGVIVDNQFDNPYFYLGADKQVLPTNSTVFIKDITYDMNLGTPIFDGYNFNDTMRRIKITNLSSSSCWLGFWFKLPDNFSHINRFNLCLAGSPSGTYKVRIRNLSWSTYQSVDYSWTYTDDLDQFLSYSFDLTTGTFNSGETVMIQVVGPSDTSFYVNWVSLSFGSLAPRFVPPNYDYGYIDGLEYNFNQGLELIEENSIRNDLSIDNAVSTGNINIPVNNNQLTTLQLNRMEQHTKNTLTTYTPYDILDSGLLYNCLYPQNNTAGWYGAKVSVNNLGIYDFIPANSTFYLDIDSCFGVYLSGGTYFKGRNKLFVCFFDSKNQLITLNNNGSYSETNFCYNLANYSDLTDYSSVISGLVNFPTQFDSTYKDKALVCWLTDSSTMYFNLPYNVSYVGLFSYFDSDQMYYCYSGKLGYLPSNNYTSGFEQGFESGKIVGLTQGKNQGYADAKEYYERYGADYSFMGLMTSVVDAPIEVIGRILDFEIFGYNMRAFFFSILAIALVLLIVGKFV